MPVPAELGTGPADEQQWYECEDFTSELLGNDSMGGTLVDFDHGLLYFDEHSEGTGL